MNQTSDVNQAFGKMEDIPGAAHGQAFYHSHSLAALMDFQANLQSLAEVPGATLDWAVGFTRSNSSKSFRWNMEWKADGSMLDMKPSTRTIASRPIMFKKNLIDTHSSDQKWLDVNCRHHSSPFVQARLEEWLAYAETQIEKVKVWEHTQKLQQLQTGVNNEERKLNAALSQIDSNNAYITLLADPDYIETYVKEQVQQTEAKNETLLSQIEGIQSALEQRVKSYEEYVEAHKV
jgi:hypothetical protein